MALLKFATPISSDAAAMRRLWLLTFLRLVLAATMTVALATASRGALRDAAVVSAPMLAAAYFLAACAALWTVQFSQLPWRSQLYGQLLVDVLLLSLLVHVLGGGAGGYALLLMFPLAAAGSMLQWPFALFTAAMAAIGFLLDGAWRQNILQLGVDWGIIGLHGGAGFALVALLRFTADRIDAAALLARTAVAQSALADVLQETSPHQHAPGVLVVNAEFEVLTINSTARLLALQAKVLLERGHFLNAAPALAMWQAACSLPQETAAPWPPESPTDTLHIRATPLPDAQGHAMLHLELDSVRQADAQAQNLAGMGRLTASIAHEIRNPLAAISQAAQLLAEAPDLPHSDRTMVAMIQTNALRIERIVGDVLDWSRALRIKPSRVDAVAYIHALCAELHELSVLPNAQALVVADTFSCPEIWVDAAHLRQILNNLLTNAARFAQQGGGHVEVQLHARDYALLIAVLDDGPPVAKTVKAHLFEPFQTDSPQGTGLGLFLAREYAKANGGDVRLIETAQREPSRSNLVPIPFAKAFVLSVPWASVDSGT